MILGDLDSYRDDISRKVFCSDAIAAIELSVGAIELSKYVGFFGFICQMLNILYVYLHLA